MGIAALVLGIIAMVIGWTGFGFIPGVIALVLGLISFIKKKDKKGLVGAILGVVGSLTYFLTLLICSSILSSVSDSGSYATVPQTTTTQTTTPQTTTSYDIEGTSDIDVDELIGDIFGSGDKEDKEDKKDKEDEEEGKVKKNKDGKKFYVGDVVKGDNWILTYKAKGDFKPDNMFYEAKPNTKLVYVEVEVENISGSDQIVAATSFHAYADNKECDWYCSKEDLSATLSDGRKASGKAVFEVPKDAKTIEFEFNDNLWKSKKILLVVQE